MSEDDGLWALIQFLLFYLLVVPPFVKIIGKTGLSRWLALLLILGPLGNFLLLPILGFRQWKDNPEEGV